MRKEGRFSVCDLESAPKPVVGFYDIQYRRSLEKPVQQMLIP